MGTKKSAKFVILAHIGHLLNIKDKFGSYLYKSEYEFSTYIVSLCRGKISAIRDVNLLESKRNFEYEISSLDENLIEYPTCSEKIFDKNKNNKILDYPRNFAPNHVFNITDFNFEGFFVVPNSRPLESSK